MVMCDFWIAKYIYQPYQLPDVCSYSEKDMSTYLRQTFQWDLDIV